VIAVAVEDALEGGGWARPSYLSHQSLGSNGNVKSADSLIVTRMMMMMIIR
jgi:hypothetical protein